MGTEKRNWSFPQSGKYLSALAAALMLHSNAHLVVAEESGNVTNRVLVTVRTIQAQGRIEDSSAMPASTQASGIPIRIDGRLEDLADKLKRLPFRGFVYVDSFRRSVPVRKKELIPLVNGQTLALRPLYSDNSKVGLWLHWQDREGAEILDTRMHLDVGQSMIAGTDLLNDPSSGLVLAVEVHPETEKTN